jgi:uncharacterized membrane protein YfcA
VETVFASPAQFLVACLILACAEAIYVLLGFGAGLVAVGLLAIFLLMTVVRVPSYAAFGLITAPRIWSSLALIPAAVLGAAIGDRIHLRLDETTFRRLVSVALIVIGVTLLARSL